jgi:uncharacterized protein
VERLGTLAALRRYPVKSMAGEDLTEARVTYAGLVGDRVYAFIDNQNKSDFPWMGARQTHDFILFRPKFFAPPHAADELFTATDYTTKVTTPEGESFTMGDPLFTEFLEKRTGRSLRLRFSERCMTDARPVSIFGTDTVRALSEECGVKIDPRQFRANFYVQWENRTPYYEDTLIGREMQIGETVVVQAVKKDARCIMITLDPETAASSPKVLETVYHSHEGYIGIYGAVLREGIVRVGDPIDAV